MGKTVQAPLLLQGNRVKINYEPITFSVLENQRVVIERLFVQVFFCWELIMANSFWLLRVKPISTFLQKRFS